jgi:hypothetical protein
MISFLTPDNLVIGRLRAAPVLAALIVTVISALVLVGWSFEIDFLKRIIPGYVFMNPTTAVAFVLSSIALWLLQSRNADEFVLFRSAPLSFRSSV